MFLRWPDFGLFEYEVELARREAETLSGGSVKEVSGGLLLEKPLSPPSCDALTYFGSIESEDSRRLTRQAEIEARHREITGRRGVKQSTRFLVHDLHEYKGKFNPQMARALINVYAGEAKVVVDPYSGSGTTSVEAVRLGKSTVGVDANPLAAWMGNVKLQVLVHEDPSGLAKEFKALRRRVCRWLRLPLSKKAPTPWAEEVEAYLAAWFPKGNLDALAQVLLRLDGEPSLPADLVRLAISSTARRGSFQLPDDLRIRRRPQGSQPEQMADLLGEALNRVDSALEEQRVHGPIPLPPIVEMRLGDAKLLHEIEIGSQTPRAIVTSPPYATALPYVDTDRLSIVLLGLASPSCIRSLDSKLTGSREWSKAAARQWESRMEANELGMPGSVIELVRLIERRNRVDEAGFRRAAVPGLLYRYFAEMTACFVSWSKFLQPGEMAVLVVGMNRTAGSILINTPELLADCASQVGFELEEVLSFQVWQRYALHSKNSVPGESAIVLRRS